MTKLRYQPYLLIAGLSLLIFSLCFYSVYEQSLFFHLNYYVQHFFISSRPQAAPLTVVLTTLAGEKDLLWVPAITVCLIALARRRWIFLLHFCALAGLIFAGKIILAPWIALPRPPGLNETLSGFAFPSGHAMLAAGFYGFFAHVWAQQVPSYKRWQVYMIAFMLIAIIATTRLYLNAHWFLDVLAGSALGLLFTSIVGLSYQYFRLKFAEPQVIIRYIALIWVLSLAAAGFAQPEIFNYENTAYTLS